jgi:hypothetical protein
MSYTVNPELLSLAKRALFEKSAVVPPGGGMDPAAMAQGAVPPADPMQAAMGAAPPPGDPAAAGAAPPGAMDPSMMGGLPPAPPAPPAAAGAPAGQKLKPEQMMQMIDYRLYNMQQQLTAIMNAMGVQVAPESLVLPPGTTGAPPAETALPGGPMAPPPAGAPPGGDPAAMGGDPAAMGGDPAAAGGAPPKMANWWDRVDQEAARIGRPIDTSVSSTVSESPATDLQTKASAVAALCRSLTNHAG